LEKRALAARFLRLLVQEVAMRAFPIRVLLFTALAPAAALAEPGYSCRALDLNGDRLIQPSEFYKVVNGGRSAASGASAAQKPSPAFRHADRNHDGYLSQSELDRLPVPPPGGGWMALDENHDGRIAPSEFRRLRR
jgi:hypothetical protein